MQGRCISEALRPNYYYFFLTKALPWNTLGLMYEVVAGKWSYIGESRHQKRLMGCVNIVVASCITLKENNDSVFRLL